MPSGEAALACVRDYHERTKHRLQRYAAGPETLDWDAQPDPFRRWSGAPLALLPLGARALAAARPLPWAALQRGQVPALPLHRDTLALLLELSFAISAWKQTGPDRWAVRCNPSSGNLHPGEAWLFSAGVPGLSDGLYHYAPKEHGLERRADGRSPMAPDVADPARAEPRAWLALSSIHWREAWKYGERAFRYGQLDAGHALGALRYAAAVLGWTLVWRDDATGAQLAHWLGLDRGQDFGAAGCTAEREDPEWLVELRPHPSTLASPTARPGDAWRPGGTWSDATVWQGQASRLDPRPMYRWPVIDDVAAASRRPDLPADELDARPAAAAPLPAPARTPTDAVDAGADVDARAPDAEAVALILGRRSAQRYDRRAVMPAATFRRLLAVLQAAPGTPRSLPFDALPEPARVHLLLFVHRVEGLAPGACWLPRSASGDAQLRAHGGPDLLWAPEPGWTPDGAPPLTRLAVNPALAGTLRTLNCHQALGADAMVAVAMLAEFDGVLQPPARPLPWRYRALLQEAGLIGQALYLEAEAAGLRGTGIGCYFDDALHELVGLQGRALQSLYHFTLGQAVQDPRIVSEPPYPARDDRPPFTALDVLRTSPSLLP